MPTGAGCVHGLGTNLFGSAVKDGRMNSVPVHETEELNDEDLERLSQDPRNRVFRSETVTEREPWDMDIAIPMFQCIHALFHSYCAASTADARRDEETRRKMYEATTGEWRRLIDDHPTIFEKLTDRATVTNPSAVQVVWDMLALHRAVGKGDLTTEEAQVAFVQRTLPRFASHLESGAHSRHVA